MYLFYQWGGWWIDYDLTSVVGVGIKCNLEVLSPIVYARNPISCWLCYREPVSQNLNMLFLHDWIVYSIVCASWEHYKTPCLTSLSTALIIAAVTVLCFHESPILLWAFKHCPHDTSSSLSLRRMIELLIKYI